MDNRPCPFVRSTYYMNAERPWTTCGEGTFPTHHEQAVLSDPKQTNHLFSAHFPQQKPSMFKPSAYVDEMPSYFADYYMENSPNLARIVENGVGTIDKPMTTEPCSQTQQNVPQNTIVANFGGDSLPSLPAPQEAAKPKPKYTGKQWETSAYAWNFHEEVPDIEDTIKLDFEVGKDVFAAASQALPLEYSNNIEEMESPVEYMKPKNSAQVHSTFKSEKYISPLESQYIGLPNDLYLVYSTCPQQFPDITVSNVIQSPYEHQTVHAEPVQAYQQPTGIVEAGIDPKDLPAPVHFPAAHYAAQYSPYGEAFSPVRPSAYQQEELNDLVSCVDGM